MPLCTVRSFPVRDLVLLLDLVSKHARDGDHTVGTEGALGFDRAGMRPGPAVMAGVAGIGHTSVECKGQDRAAVAIVLDLHNGLGA